MLQAKAPCPSDLRNQKPEVEPRRAQARLPGDGTCGRPLGSAPGSSRNTLQYGILSGPRAFGLHREHKDSPIGKKPPPSRLQVETIHPFLDGNGRLGRLLIVFLLCAARAIREPILYLRLYLKTKPPETMDCVTAFERAAIGRLGLNSSSKAHLNCGSAITGGLVESDRGGPTKADPVRGPACLRVKAASQPRG